MLDKDTYLKELTRYFNSIRDDDYKNKVEDPTDCIGVSCKDCIFSKKYGGKCIFTMGMKHMFEVLEVLEKWSKDHPQKKYEVPQILYDALSLLAKYGFSIRTADGMTIEEYLEHCEVVDKIKINERGTDEQIKD